MSDSDDSAADLELEHCANCGDSLPSDVWCPITTEDGPARLLSFCDEACLEAWREECE